jgi:5-(hydroxymethyl)furfural/furfural oxidase
MTRVRHLPVRRRVLHTRKGDVVKRSVVIVGGGSAGCVLAGRLSADPSIHVTLLEAGPIEHAAPHGEAALAGASFFDALAVPGRTWVDLVATRSPVQAARPYTRGRGLGGCSSVNAMVALPTHPDDHVRWVELGAVGWGWDEVAAHYLHHDLVTNVPAWHEVGPVSAALLESEPGAARLARLTRDDVGRRVSAADAYVTPYLGRDNLDVRGNAHVDSVLLEGRRAVGVRLVLGDEVVVAAGAIHSPAILLRSAIDRRGIGRNLKDHAALPIVIHLRPEYTRDPSTLPISVIGQWSSGEAAQDIQLLPLDHLGPEAPGLGMLMVALMTVESSGVVELASTDPLRQPLVDMRMLSTEGDLRRLRHGAERALALLRTPTFQRIGVVEDVDLSDDGMRAAMGDYVHASGTCRMGAPADPDAVVDPSCQVVGYEHLTVCDASVMPDVPRANTHLITVVIAERVAAQMLARSSSIDSRK